ncbi:MAG TPA: class 1 fructose-bisphosphatase [Polyangiales bacterium]|nr:class 1 fructose-bisphosphatase [Polyangiales bacterium]
MSSRVSIGPAEPSPIGTTLERHLLDRQRRMAEATGDFTGLFQQITLAAKIIGSRVSKAGLSGILGRTGTTNVQGEQVQKLDDFANTTIVSTVEAGGHVCVMGSEEVEEPIAIPAQYPQGKYVLQFDPLDGSGNIDINASIGTIFSIHRRLSPEGGPGSLRDLLQPGRDIVAAGYIVYGSSNMLVYSTGDQVDGFTYDPGVGEFFLSHPKIRIPTRGGIYSINEGNYHSWDTGIRNWVDWIKTPSETKPAYRLRYIGAMVADLHRTLLRGGIFVYPSDAKNRKGKLRLLYEASPMAFLVEAAGGTASDGKNRILDIAPTALHQRTPVFMGSPDDVADALRFAAS